MRRFFPGRAKRPGQVEEGNAMPAARISTSPSPRKPFPSGIKLLYAAENSVVDILFVHGLNGDREKTWTAKNTSEPWPRTLLPSKVPNARVLTFGYDTYVADWRGLVSQVKIGNHAMNLLTTLASYREDDDTNNRPIIFVCHSLGGLVCEDALARQRPEPEVQNILRATRGIVFLGTPHHGAGLAKWAEMLAMSVGLVKQTNPDILTVLKRDSEVLARIQDSFHTMIRARNQGGLPPIEITCFYEELPLRGFGVVVPLESAILPGYVPIGIHQNHMDMTKFEREDDPGFTAVAGELRRWVKELSAPSEAGVARTAVPPPPPQQRSQIELRQQPGTKLTHSNYTVGWICALATELAVARAMLDERHDSLPQDRRDNNNYTLGRIGPHHVAIACLSDGVMGVTSAARVAEQMLWTFTSLRFGLMVGIGGGVPGGQDDIRLGDVVVSRPEGSFGGVIQYDYGKTVQRGRFEKIGSLNRPPDVLLKALASVKAAHMMEGPMFPRFLSEMGDKFPRLRPASAPPASSADRLFKADYDHVEGEMTCAKCRANQEVIRRAREESGPMVHYGLIASGNQVMKHGKTRERLRRELNILCFEMEAAGLMDSFPCLVIRGICDYADTHKNKEWQLHAAAAAAAYAKELLNTIPGSQIEATETATKMTTATATLSCSTYFEVPKRRVKDFIGREAELLRISSYFSTEGDSQPRPLILQALGGQGKSQIALEYCQRSQSTYRGIFWVNAASEATATQSFVNFADKLGPASSDALQHAKAKIQSVKNTLEQWSERWLLVFDNYDNPEHFATIQQFIPSGGRGNVIFTSRSRGLDRLGTVVEVPPLNPEEGLTLLLRGYDVRDRQHDVNDEGSKIITKLGGLPLAIDQAAAYIQYKKIPLERLPEFLAEYEAHKEKILQYTPQNFWEYGTMQIHGKEEENQAISAFTTWEMSFQQLESDTLQKENAAHFLTVSAFLDPSNIGEYLFRNHWEANAPQPEWMQLFSAAEDEDPSEDSSEKGDRGDGVLESALLPDIHSHRSPDDGASIPPKQGRWDSDRFWDLIHKSHQLSLVQSIGSREEHGDAKFSLHPLIRDWLQLREKSRRRRSLTYEAIDLVVTSIREYTTRPATADLKSMLIAHMDTCLSNDSRFSKPQRSLGQDISGCDTAAWFASFYSAQGLYREAEKLEQLNVETRKRVLGQEHPSTLINMGNLASTFWNQGRWKEAEELNVQVMETFERVLGQEHPDTLTSMANLALTFWNQGRWKEAEELDVQVIETRKRVLGQEHSDTLASMGNLASTFWNQGRWKEAEELNVQVMETFKRVLGQEHPDTLTSMANLASTFWNQGRWKEAEELNVQVIETRKRVLGQEHPNTLTSMANLASTFWNQGRWKEAEELEVQAMETRKRVLGQEHPDTLTSMANLAYTWKSQGRDKEAIDLMKEAERLQRDVLGPGHPDSMNSARTLYRWQIPL